MAMMNFGALYGQWLSQKKMVHAASLAVLTCSLGLLLENSLLAEFECKRFLRNVPTCEINPQFLFASDRYSKISNDLTHIESL